MTDVRVLGPDEAEALAGELAEVLLDAIAGGASVSFMAGLPRSAAETFWRGVAREVRERRRALLAAFEGGALVGTAQLDLDTPPNQPHRAAVAKVLVHRRARRLGIGRCLMEAVEVEARARGRSLLTLDTAVGSAADQLYTGLGYVRVGEIPGYALFPDGTPCATAVFYKALDM